MFETERFIAACQAAVREGQAAVRELVTEAVSDPAAIIAALGEPAKAGLHVLHRGANVTVINFVWAPYMTLMPHNHNMFSVVGLYNGREDNVFWRRIEREGEDRRGPSIEAAGAKSMGSGEVATLGRDIIHSVCNPIGKWSAAIHVYGGDFFAPPEPRSQWAHETLIERPWRVDDARTAFHEAEQRYNAGVAAAQAPV